jgi:squalene-associated FAD-dependent desaturase
VKVAVIGGGFAGLTAAVDLQKRGHAVTLVERRGVLGGRATSSKDAITGDAVDSGTHLMVGAYRETLALLREAGASDLVRAQPSLKIDYVDGEGVTSLDCPRWPAPFHLLVGLMRMRLPKHVRREAARLALAIKLGAPPHGLTLAEYFRKTGQSAEARALLWDGLSIAILNETPERAAAILFYNVYRAAFLRRHADSRLVFACGGLGEIHERLGAYFERQGGTILKRARVEALRLENGRVIGLDYAQAPRERALVQVATPATDMSLTADAIVLATPWHGVGKVLPAEWREKAPFADIARLRGAPIVSVEMWLDRVVVDRPMLGLRGCEVEWVFDKGRLHGREGAPQHLSFIVSAAYRTTARPNAEILAVTMEALHKYFPEMIRATPTRALVLRDPDATFSCGPEAEAFRPGPTTPIGGLYLAGDWTNTGLPATIEGAVRSGHAAATALLSR